MRSSPETESETELAAALVTDLGRRSRAPRDAHGAQTSTSFVERRVDPGTRRNATCDRVAFGGSLVGDRDGARYISRADEA